MRHSSSIRSNQPIVGTDRFLVLDAVRGFALLGIMFVNMTWFTGFAVLSADQRRALGSQQIDLVVNWLIEVFVAGKFWTIFAFLFGVGAAIQFGKFDGQTDSATGPYVRRTTVLLLLGLSHGFFLWFGDIMSLYAVAGFALLLFISKSDQTNLLWAGALLVLPIVQMAIWLIACQISGCTEGVDPGHGPAELLTVFAAGTYREVLAANYEFLQERWLIAVYDGRFLKLTGLFLVGWWSGKQQVLWRADEHHTLLLRVVLIAVLIGMPANLLAASCFAGVSLRPPSLDGLLVASLKTIGIPALGLGYVAALSIWLTRQPRSILAQMLAIAGRLSLTNYVMQSIIGVIIFYGYGFGQWGSYGVAWSIPLILMIFAFQVLFSYFWLRLFKYGPLEWVWRSMSYWRVLPILNLRPPSQPIIDSKGE